MSVQLVLFDAPPQRGRWAPVVVPAETGPQWRHHGYCPMDYDPDTDDCVCEELTAVDGPDEPDAVWVGRRRMPVQTVAVRDGVL